MFGLGGGSSVDGSKLSGAIGGFDGIKLGFTAHREGPPLNEAFAQGWGLEQNGMRADFRRNGDVRGTGKTDGRIGLQDGASATPGNLSRPGNTE